MDLFGFVSWSLVTLLAVTLIFPPNVLLLALAYKVRQGRKPIDMEGREFWIRCILGSLGLAGCSLVLVGLSYALTRVMQMHGAIQLILLIAYLPAAVGYLFWVLALEDMVQALSLFLLYILLPGLPLLLVGRFTGLWEAVRQSAPWLLYSS